MCGFVGSLFTPSQSPALVGRLPAALGRLAHRGPDGHGELVLPHGLFGHARLSIIDLTDAASQPMQSGDGQITLVFNGEIYNYRELYHEHLQDWPEVNPNSDTSVLLGMYARYGEDLLRHLNGMFAFVIWDARSRTAFMARDRFGEKPLYYASTAVGLTFGSECRALQALHPGALDEIDSVALGAYLHLGSVHAPRTIFRNIRSLPPGHCASVSFDRWSEVRVRRYWRAGSTITPETVANISLDDARAETARLLTQALRSRLVSDVPVGLFLSGGIDSGAICSLAQTVGHTGMTGVFVDFSEAQFSEFAMARLTAQQFGVNMHRIEVTPAEFLGNLDAFFRASDQPTADGFNTYIVADAARRVGGKVWLSGVGGDELFGGYPLFDRMRRLRSLSRMLQSLNSPALLDFLARRKSLPMRVRRALAMGQPGANASRAFQAARAPLPLSMACSLLAVGRRPLDTAYIDEILAAAVPETGDDFQLASVFETQLYMGGQLLRDMDNFSMAHSLELRAPFLDHRLYDFVYQLPAGIKRQGMGKKPLLAGSLANPLPDAVRFAPKRGFTFPLEVWMKSTFNEAFDQVCSDPRIADLLDIDAVRQLWKAYQANQLHWSVVWIPFALGRWLMARP